MIFNKKKDVQSINKINYMNNYIGHKSTKARLVFEGIASGAVASVITVLYRIFIDKADDLRNIAINMVRADWKFGFIWVLFLVVGGLLIALMLKYEPMSSGSGIPQIKGMILGLIDANWIKVIIAKFIGGIVAILGGLSLGREGPSIQLGSSAAVGLGKLFKRNIDEERFVLTCGASAGLATAFNAPLAGLIFSLEEMHKTFSPIVLISALSSCVVADFISKQVFGMSPVLNFTGIEMLPLGYYPYIIPLGIMMGFIGLLFNKSLIRTQSFLSAKYFPPMTVPVIVMVIVGTTGLLFPQALGGGHNLIMSLTKMSSIKFLILLLLVKFMFTMLSYGSGAPGGIFLPLLAIGALAGSIYGNTLARILNIPEIYISNFIILAMAGAFTAIVKAPVTGIILIVEMTASFKTLLPVLLVCLIAFITAELLDFEPIYDTLLHRLLKKTLGIKIPHGSKKDILEFTVNAGSLMEDRYLKDISLPMNSLVINITRGNMDITPNGKFKFHVGDIVAILCDKSSIHEIRGKMLKMTM